jgi:hypothetical protein
MTVLLSLQFFTYDGSLTVIWSLQFCLLWQFFYHSSFSLMMVLWQLFDRSSFVSYDSSFITPVFHLLRFFDHSSLFTYDGSLITPVCSLMMVLWSLQCCLLWQLFDHSNFSLMMVLWRRIGEIKEPSWSNYDKIPKNCHGVIMITDQRIVMESLW